MGAIRLSKLFGLIKNEYIKQLHKRSTLIILVLVALGTIGFTGLIRISTLEYEDYYVGGEADYTVDTEYVMEIKDATDNGDTAELEYYNYLRSEKISQFDWRKALADTAFDRSADVSDAAFVAASNYNGDASELYKRFISEHDWRGYCEFLKDNIPESASWAVQYRLDNDVPLPDDKLSPDNDWRNDQLDYYLKNALIAEGTTDHRQKEHYEDMMLTAKYRVEHDVSYNIAGTSITDGDSGEFDDEEVDTRITMYTAFSASTMVVTFIGLLIIIIAGGTVASEFSNGTIKFLLINPRSRGRILVSKYITVITAGYALIVISYILALISSVVMFGADDIGAMYVRTTSGSTTAVPGPLYVFGQFMLSSIYVVVMATFAFALSSLVKSASLAIGLGIFLMTMGQGAVELLKEAFNIDAVRFTIFANSNLQSIARGQTMFAGQTVGFALCIIAIHMIVFLLTAWDGFVRRDV